MIVKIMRPQKSMVSFRGANGFRPSTGASVVFLVGV